MSVVVTLAFLILLSIQELSRAHGSEGGMLWYSRLNRPVLVLGLGFAAIVLWRVVELAQ